MPAGPEASTFRIQTLLFVIGGLLLGAGAIAFTVVAWTTFGRAGQAAILAAATLLMLAVPVVARRRGLRGTAETFAVLGLLLVLLDGYAAWRVGLVGDLPAATWAGLVCGVTALVAVPYARRPGGGGAPWSGAGGVPLAGPGFAALVLAQPVLPLLAAEPVRELSGAAPRLAALGWLLALLAAGNLAIRWRLGTGGRELRILSWTLTGAALATATAISVLAMFAAVGAALVLAGLGLVHPPAHRDGWLAARVPATLAAVVLAAPQLAVVLAGPYSWLGDIWAGAPAGVGLLAGGGWPANRPAALGLVLLTGAAALASRALAGRWSGALLVAPVAVLVGLAELGAPWPVVPAVSLLLGVVAMRWRPGSWYGLVLVGAGLAGSLPARWSTLAGLGVALVVATVVGVAGRTPDARIAGWPAAVASAVLFAVAATRAADQPLPSAGFAVLGVAAVAVVVVGARARLQAPVMVGGAVAALVALRELGLVWQLLDTWIPLTVAGLILVGMAATYERRRRDLARLRAAVRHMT